MEKLIELLSRYGKDDDWCLVRVEGNVRKIDEMLIISKQYGFIKWLVENDKIDFEKLYDRVSDYCEDLVPYPADECLLMLLSISDNPIDDLILYLK